MPVRAVWAREDKHSVQQMQQLLENNGMSPANARVLAAVGMGESGGNAGIDTVQSGLDPKQVR